METRRDVFHAIADPTRREIIQLVARKSLNVGAIADNFSSISRQAVALHIKILTECGILTLRQEGRERICNAQIKKLAEVYDWVVESQKLWAGRMDVMENLLSDMTTARKKVSKKK